MNGRRPSPQVSFETYDKRTYMKIDDRVVEAMDTIGENIRDIVSTHQAAIDEELLFREEYNRHFLGIQRLSRPSILVARLAVSQYVPDALTTPFFFSQKQYFDSYTELRSNYISYWRLLDETKYTVRGILQRDGEPDLHGAWLSIEHP